MNAIELVWDKAALRLRQKRFAKAQSYVDRQCVEKMTPYVPVGLPRFRNSGRLRDSVRIAEPGRIVYTAPLARHDYYSAVNHEHGGNPQAQRLWFEVMKKKHGGAILRSAAAVMGGKAE